METRVVGIDLGTTNSVVATVDESGSVVVLPSASGSEITPSVVYFEPDGSVLVGGAAIRASTADQDNGVRLVKRAMGTEFPLRLRDQDHTPESISALILRYLVGADGASAARGGKTRAVITVPAYFGTREREATHQAGLIAGLDVLELLDEPVAAATHYGLTSGDQTLLVYDLGGGTFDTTVLRIRSGVVQVLATDGHHELGGADVDARLLDLVMERLEAELPSAELDELAEDQALYGALALEVEAAKKDLSSRTSLDLRVTTAAGKEVTVPLTREDLDDACGDLYATTAEIIGRVLQSARVEAGSLDEVIMVGGSSRIPALSQRLAEMLGKEPRLVEPDLAVAKGAALRAHRLVGSTQLAALTAARGSALGRAVSLGQVAPAAPRAIGILIEDSGDPAGQRSYVEHLVTANMQLPVSQVETRFGTILPNQGSVRIQVYEQAGPVPSAEVEHNRRVLDGELTGLSKLPAGSVIRLTMNVAVDGRLTVIAHEPRSGRELRLEAFVEGVIDSAESERLTNLVGRSVVRG